MNVGSAHPTRSVNHKLDRLGREAVTCPYAKDALGV
jgi:hypothetical protein